MTRPWLFLLSALLLNCAGTPEGSDVHSKRTPVDDRTMTSDLESSHAWPDPEQERWVEEPVFQGSLHLVEGGQENTQTIVLIHGLGDKGILDWQQVFPTLTQDYHVIAIDLPGFGGSDSHQVQYAPEKYAQLVSWVVSQHSHGPVVVIGHSMGGAVGLRYAHNYPEQVDRLIMVDVAGVLQRTVFVKHLAKVPDSYEWSRQYQAAIPGLDRLFKQFSDRADNLTQSLLVMMDRMPDVPALMMSSGLAQRYLYKDRTSMNAAMGLVYEDFSVAAREVDIPTHIIWGENDTVAPVRTGVVLADIMTNAQLHIIPDATHVPMAESFDEFMTILNQSLENEPRARQARQRLEAISKEPPNNEDTRCHDADNSGYTGRHKAIRLSHCRGVVLRDLVAESIEVVNSEVSLENVKLMSPSTGLTVTNSVVTATLLQVHADVGMLVDSSYLDLAGADFFIDEKLVEIQEGVQLYFSLSQSHQNQKTVSLHGMSLGNKFKLQ